MYNALIQAECSARVNGNWAASASVRTSCPIIDLERPPANASVPCLKRHL
jgi:hypothetical protein